jgi:cyclopropane fatty-acyl-phospholipid synthase-like methyltransferase
MSNDSPQPNDIQEYNEDYTLDGPSELGLAAVDYLKDKGYSHQYRKILDIACGNGRDSFYFINNLDCEILGIDISSQAIDLAKNKTTLEARKNMKFECKSYSDLTDGEFDIIFSSGLYHFLKKNERELMRNKIVSLLKPCGLLFLSTLSVNDPFYYGSGKPVQNEPHTFIYSDQTVAGVYLHFSTKDELMDDFSYLDIKRLFEHEDYNPKIKGPVNYIPWILVGENTRV